VPSRAHDNVIGAVQRLAFPLVGEHRRSAVRFEARQPPLLLLADQQATLPVEGEPVRKSRFVAKNRLAFIRTPLVDRSP